MKTPFNRSKGIALALLACWAGSTLQAFTPISETLLPPSTPDWFGNAGQSVALDVETVAMGAPGQDSVDLFSRGPSGWIHESAINDGVAAYTAFGWAVALSGDWLAVGAPEEGSSGAKSGAVFLFQRGESGWFFTQRIVAPDAVALQKFGESVALRGDRLVVGAPGDDQASTPGLGSVYVFQRAGGSWIHQAKIEPSAPQAGAWFGKALAVDGDRLAVGAPGQTVNRLLSAGAVWVYDFDGTAWQEEQQLTSGSPGAAALFGSSVALESDVMVVGAPGASGSASVWQESPTGWTQTASLTRATVGSDERFGHAVALSGTTAIVGDNTSIAFGVEGGAVYTYSRDATGQWPQVALVGPAVPELDGRFGTSLGFNGTLLVVGAPNTDVTDALMLVMDAGTAHVFEAAPEEPPAGEDPPGEEPPVPNNPPVADASATTRHFVAGVNGEAMVLLDGILSSDPDGDALTASWSLGGTTVGTDLQTALDLPTGTHTVTLVVSDGIDEDADSVEVVVQSLSDAIDALQRNIRQARLPRGHQRACLRILTAAERALDRGRTRVAAHLVRITQHLLNLSVRRGADADVVADLVAEADVILSALQMR